MKDVIDRFLAWLGKIQGKKGFAELQPGHFYILWLSEDMPDESLGELKQALASLEEYDIKIILVIATRQLKIISFHD